MYKKEIVLDAYIRKKTISMNAVIRNRAGGGDFFVKHDISLIGDGNTIPLGVNTEFVATKEDLNIKADKATTLAGYGITDAYTKAETDAKIGAVYHVKGSVADYDSLPDSASIGDVYNILDTGANYVWTEDGWDKLSETVDLSGYATKEELAGKQDKLTAGENITIEDGVISGDFLPLTGGTLTGRIGFDTPPIPNIVVPVIGSPKSSSMYLYIATDSSGTPKGLGVRGGLAADYLGESSKKVEAIYVKTINNGADITVPTEGGTMARIEDIDEVVGDISTALTAILGE